MAVEHPDQWPHIEGELRNALTCPIENLARPEHRALAGDVGQHWDIPLADRVALQEHGLPRLQLFTAAPQPERAPLLVPNLAGEREHGGLSDGSRLYKLGFWGRSEETGVTGVAPDGRVFYLLPAPITEADLPEVLKPFYPGLYKPAASLLSSSITQFIEISWRWRAALDVLGKVEEPLYSAPEPELTAHYERLYSCVEHIVEAARRIDVSAVAEDPNAGWIELIRANTV
jgi:hypothetical protein